MKRFLLFSFLMMSSLPLFGGTYYIDFTSGSDANNGTAKATPWLHAPGMPGFTGTYTHHNGDIFVFKGGTTCGSLGSPCFGASGYWNVTNGGASGSPDTYTVDQTWYDGGSYTPPVIDGGSMNPVAHSPYLYFTKSYVTLNGLKVQNIGVAGTNQGNYAIEFQNGSGITVTNMTLPVESRIALYFLNNSAKTLSTFAVSGNDISNCSWGIAFATASARSITSGVNIYGNIIHDFHSQIASAAHGDGIYLFGPGNDATQYFNGVYIYNNYFYGDFSKDDASAANMTSFIWPSSPAGTAYVYNNHSTYTGGVFTGPYLAGGVWTGFSGTGTVYIYNNSALGDTNGGYFVYANGLTTLVVENNIASGNVTGYTVGATQAVTNFTSNYNDFYNWSNSTFARVGATNYTYAAFKTAGYEANGANADPQFTSTTDLHLKGTSPAIGIGLNLTSTCSTTAALCLDADSVSRPASAAWDSGAYLFVPIAGACIVALDPGGTLTLGGQVGVTAAVTLTNQGSGDCTGPGGANLGANITLNNAQYTQSNNCGALVGTLGTCTITVGIAQKGSLSATLSVASTDANTPATLAVSGTGSVQALSGTASVNGTATIH